MIKKILLTVMLTAFLCGQVFAAAADDFSYQGIKLGDTKQIMDEKFGPTKVKIEKLVAERWITYYKFKDVRIGIDGETGCVVDIRSSDKEYTAKGGVKIGATNHKILKEYGKVARERIGGRQYYLYQLDGQRLMFDMTPGYLEEIRITSLSE